MDKKSLEEQSYEAMGKLTAKERYVINTHYHNVEVFKTQHFFIMGILLGALMGGIVGIVLVML